MEENINGKIIKVEIVNNDEKLSKKLGDLCFGIVIAMLVSVFAETIFTDITNEKFMVLVIGVSVAVTAFISGIVFYKMGGLRWA